MAERVDSVLLQIEGELNNLREAIIGNDITAIESHTAQTRELLGKAKESIESVPSEGYSSEIPRLQAAARTTGRLLAKATRTVNALIGVYQVFLQAPSDALLERR